MLGCMYFDKTRRIDDSFWPDGLSGSITASIWMLEFSLSTTMALYKVKIERRVREAKELEFWSILHRHWWKLITMLRFSIKFSYIITRIAILYYYWWNSKEKNNLYINIEILTYILHSKPQSVHFQNFAPAEPLRMKQT